MSTLVLAAVMALAYGLNQKIQAGKPNFDVDSQNPTDTKQHNALRPLQSRYKEQEPTFDSRVYNYDWKDDPTVSDFERQHRVLTTDTPAKLGALPDVNRGSGTALINPMAPHELRPPKRDIFTEEFFSYGPEQPTGRRRASQITGELYRRARDQAKQNTGVGAYNDFHLFNAVSDVSHGGATARGLFHEPRLGGFHPRERYYRRPDFKRGKNEFEFRYQHPTVAHNEPGSVWGTGTAPLGETRTSRYADVAEYYQPPVKLSNPGGNFWGRVETVPLRYQNRDDGLGVSGLSTATERPWTGPMGSQQYNQEALRDMNRRVRPKQLVENINYESAPGITNRAPDDREHTGSWLERDSTRKKSYPRQSNPNYSYGLQADAIVHGTGERFADETYLRDTQKDDSDVTDFTIRRQPIETKSYLMQYRHEPIRNAGFEEKRLLPEIERDVDQDLIAPFRDNPYAQPLPVPH